MRFAASKRAFRYLREHPQAQTVTNIKMEIDAETRAQRVSTFREVAGTELDEGLCATLLDSNGWSVEATLRQFFEGPQNSAKRAVTFESDSYGAEEEEEEADEAGALLRKQRSEEEEEEVDSDEFGGRQGDGGVRARRRQILAAGEQPQPQPQPQNRRPAPVIPSSFTSLLKEALCGSQDTVGAASLARKFADEFDRMVGPNTPGPQFFESSFDDALFSATRERRMLCIYLHSPMHPASEQFCKNVVCSRAVLQALSDVRIWGGSVETHDGYVASSKLQCAAFPCLVLLSGAEGGQQASIVDRIYWDSAAEAGEAERIALRILAAREMRGGGGRNAPPQQQQQQQQQHDSWELQERRRMVQEQDAALQRAIEDDRRKLAEKQEQERAEQEKRELAEQQAEQERNALLVKRSQVLPEPPVAAASSEAPPVATLRFNFPKGQKLARRFLASDTVGYVRIVLECHMADQGIALQRFALASNFPKRVYDNEADTLQQAGLCPQAALFVQDLDA